VHRKSGFAVLEHPRVFQRNGSIRQIPFALICASLLAALACAQSVAAEVRLLDLPQYKPEQIVTRTIRNFGFGLGVFEGQDAVQRDGKYLPLTAEVAREQLQKLDRGTP
jgi:hypothetical protein